MSYVALGFFLGVVFIGAVVIVMSYIFERM